MFGARWRWNASRALAVLRFAGGRKVPPPIQRMRADDLLAAVFPDQAACAENLTGPVRIPEHPLVKETIANCLREAMDLEGLKSILEGIRRREIRTVALDVPQPSLFSHEILNANPYAYLRRCAVGRAPRAGGAATTHAASRRSRGRQRAGPGGHRSGGSRVLAGGARCRRAARRVADLDRPAPGG